MHLAYLVSSAFLVRLAFGGLVPRHEFRDQREVLPVLFFFLGFAAGGLFLFLGLTALGGVGALGMTGTSGEGLVGISTGAGAVGISTGAGVVGNAAGTSAGTRISGVGFAPRSFPGSPLTLPIPARRLDAMVASPTAATARVATVTERTASPPHLR